MPEISVNIGIWCTFAPVSLRGLRHTHITHAHRTRTWVDFPVCGYAISIYNGLEAFSELVGPVVGGGLLPCAHAVQDGGNGAATALLVEKEWYY